MLKGAMAELEVGDPRQLSRRRRPGHHRGGARCDCEPHRNDARPRPHGDAKRRSATSAAHGTFVPPTLIEVSKIADVEREVFGPVLHVLRYKREALDKLIDDDQRRRLRPHLRPAHPHRRDDRARRRAHRGRQHLRQPQHHRRDGRRAAVRRLEAFRHRAEGGRPALSLAPRRRAGAGRAGRRGRRATQRSPASAPTATGSPRTAMAWRPSVAWA